MNERFISNRVELAENALNGNLTAKFCLCDFGVNHNKVRLNRETIEPWVSTLVNQPLVGRIGYNGDFTGHNMRVATVVNADGEKTQEVVFDTEAIGTFVSAGIEEIDGEEYVTGTAEIWRRYPNVCNLIAERVEEGTLHTSWEIIVSESHMDGDVKVIDNGCFTALCALGKNHPPAYDSSQLLEVAEANDDPELEQAIYSDVAHYKEKEESNMTEETMVSEQTEVLEPEVAEESVELTEEPVQTESAEVTEPEVSEEPAEPVVTEPEISALTVRDLRSRIEQHLWQDKKFDGYAEYIYPEEHVVLCHVYGPEYGELDYMQFTYTVSGDDVTLDDGVHVRLEATVIAMNQMLSEKNDALVTASQRIQELEAEIAELQPYREAAEQAEAARILAEKQEKQHELTQYALRSGFITSEEITGDETVQTMISELDEAGIKQLIAERFMASLQEQKSVVQAETEKKEKIETAELNLEISDDEDVSILSVYNNKLY